MTVYNYSFLKDDEILIIQKTNTPQAKSNSSSAMIGAIIGSIFGFIFLIVIIIIVVRCFRTGGIVEEKHVEVIEVH